MNLTNISKFLALVLRHKPEEAGLTLDKQGWCNVDSLVEAFSKIYSRFSVETLNEIVDTDNKKRYSFSGDGKYIRANQGHSIPVEIDFEQVDWDSLKHPLYHGTGEKYIESICKNGILPKSRNYVHLSGDYDTAVKVGQRHGKVVVLEIDLDKMKHDNIKLMRSENGVYLVDKVPVGNFTILK